MNKDNIVSVLLPTYNASSTIKATIDSILNQTHSNFELIIIDDGSTDNTRKIVSDINDDRITYIYKANGGISSALNLGIENCSSEYIARIDSDDIAYNTRLEKQYKYLKENKDTLLVGSAVDYIDGNGKVIGRTFPIIFDFLSDLIFKKRNIYAHPSVMFKKNAVIKCGGYDENLSGLMEDYYLWAKLRNLGKCRNMYEALTQYRISENQITSCKPSLKYKELERIIINNLKYEMLDIVNLRKERERIKKESNDFSKTRINGIGLNNFYLIYKYLSFFNKKNSSKITTLLKNMQVYIWYLYGK
ncbi:glycosyltransferase family 2 protein [Aliivibrio fischeri]|uniref:glycosyltransferase family 2 protein n=1 Tax=Aliivibrio fischeri TaxID=668 RepID=UPI00080E3C7C|nr:glycosyltransferase [Aliivibrio fischeri]OCH36708.1 hypothetical protein A6E02_18885 [Aliivibrio fischeri]